MPNRIIREGILSSDRVDQLDAAAEVFYRRLMSKVDDHGLFDARASMLRASLYPLRVDRVREADIARWIATCEKAGVIALYVHEGKPFGQMLDTRWQARSEPKHPAPIWGIGAPPAPHANSCAQLQTTATLDGVVVGVVKEKEKGAQHRSRQLCAPSEAVESEGDQPTPSGLACRAIRAAGIDIPGPTADLNRLVNAGVPPEEFGAVAAELVARGKGRVPLLLSTIEGRRQDAQAKGGVAAAVPVTTDPNEEIQARGASVCVGRWASGTLGDYRERVEAAERAQQGSALASVHDLAARMKA